MLPSDFGAFHFSSTEAGPRRFTCGGSNFPRTAPPAISLKTDSLCVPSSATALTLNLYFAPGATGICSTFSSTLITSRVCSSPLGCCLVVMMYFEMAIFPSTFGAFHFSSTEAGPIGLTFGGSGLCTFGSIGGGAGPSRSFALSDAIRSTWCRASRRPPRAPRAGPSGTWRSSSCRPRGCRGAAPSARRCRSSSYQPEHRLELLERELACPWSCWRASRCPARAKDAWRRGGDISGRRGRCSAW